MEYSQVLVIAISLFVAVASYLRFRDPLYPPVIHSSLWALVVFLFALNSDAFYPLSWKLYFLVGFGCFAFALGSYIATYEFRPEHKVWRFPVETNWLLVALLTISVIGLPFYVRRAYQVAAGGPTGNLLVDLRFNMLVQHQEFGVLVYLVPLATVVAGIHLLVAPSKRLQTAISVIVALAYSILTTGRTSAFALIFLLFGIQLVTRRLKVKYATIGILACLAVFFVGVAIVQGKGINVDASFKDNLALLGENVRTYLLGALPALDSFMRSDPAPALGAYTLRFFFVLGDKLGLALPVRSELPWVKVPAMTNVYTVYQPYFADFSFPGAATVQIFLGFFHGILYRRATSGDPMFICLFSLALYPLALQVFAEQYFLGLSLWIQCTIVLWVYFRLWGMLRSR